MLLKEIAQYLAGTVLGFISLALLARFFMQWGRVSFRNPIGHFVIVVTDWVVLPLRRFIPGLFGLDMASLLPAWVAQILLSMFEPRLWSWSGDMLMLIPLLGLLNLARMAAYLVFGIVLVAAVLSWVGPHAPMAYVFDELSRPFLAPFRRLIRPLGGIDLSPLILLVVVQIVLMIIQSLQENLLTLPLRF